MKMILKICLSFTFIVSHSGRLSAQTSNQSTEKTAKLTCDEIQQLKDLAGKKFDGLKGHKDTSDTTSTFLDYFFSKTSYGINGSTRIAVEHTFGSVSMQFSLYYGIDGRKTDQIYQLVLNELSKCLTPLGFEKQNKKYPNQNPLIDPVKETTEYSNFQLHTRYIVTLLNPTVYEIVSGKPKTYIPDNLVVVDVLRLP